MSIVSLRVFEKQSPRKWTVFREKETLAPACTLPGTARDLLSKSGRCAPGVVSDHAGECRCCFVPRFDCAQCTGLATTWGAVFHQIPLSLPEK